MTSSSSWVCKFNGTKFEFIANAVRRDTAIGDCIKRDSLLVQLPDPKTARALIKCARHYDDVKYWTGLNVCPDERFGWTRRDCSLTRDQLFFTVPVPTSTVCTGLTFNPKQFFSDDARQPMGGRDPCHDQYYYICQSDDVIEVAATTTTAEMTTTESATTRTVQTTTSDVYDVTNATSLTMLGDDVDGGVTSSYLPYICAGAGLLFLIVVVLLSVWYRRRRRSGEMKEGNVVAVEMDAVTSKEVAGGSDERRNVYSEFDLPTTSHTNAIYANLPAPVCQPSTGTDDNLDGYDGYLAPLTMKPTSTHQPTHQRNNLAGYVTQMAINQPQQQIESEYEVMRAPGYSTSQYPRDVYEN